MVNCKRMQDAWQKRRLQMHVGIPQKRGLQMHAGRLAK